MYLFTLSLVILLFLRPIALSASLQTLRSLDELPVIHFTIARRGGAFNTFVPGSDIANLTYLSDELHRIEEKFNLTRREVKGNKLVRKAKVKGYGGNGKLMGGVAVQGTWYAKISIGEPPQEIEVDLDMLTSDFFVLATTSRLGSKYDDYFSTSVVRSNAHPFPQCSRPTDTFHIPTVEISVPLEFTYCQPSRSSLETLGPSGSVLGLAPSSHLSQIGSSMLFAQLLEKKIVQRPIFSIMLINDEEGILSIGGTSAEAVKIVLQQTKEELDSLAIPSIASEDDGKTHEKRGSHALAPSLQSSQTEWHESWRWSKVQGAEGWWQILLQGVWIEDSKVIKNQPVVVDINTPFILAPPLAAKAFYASVSGSLQLPVPFDSFYIFPCLNPPVVYFEFDSWKFPAIQGGKGRNWLGIPVSRFSLGRYKEGSGYCVGAVVQTSMGVNSGSGVKTSRKGHSGLAGNGMRDVWVIGEPFFRGVGGVFNFQEQKVGFRTY
ncbi:hypothetical protein MMC13_007814 [Lambiella insularis]|nr:hypothetical protein [Lambiella insularis]